MTPFDPRSVRLLALGLVLFVAASLIAAGAARAANCGKRADIVAALAKRHGERPVSLALSSDGRLVELWTREDGRWTLIISTPQGFACVHASGERSWEELPVGDPA